MMLNHVFRGLVAVAAVASAITWPGAADASPPDAAPPTGNAWSRVLSAVETTRQKGVPTVLIVTSRRLPSSTAFGRDFLASEWTRQRRGLVLVIEASIEDDPQFVSTLKVTQYPTAVVYCGSDAGLLRYETSNACASVASLGAWLGRLVDGPLAASSTVMRADRAVVRAGHHGDSYPSPQSSAPPCPQPTGPASVPVAPQPTPAATTMASVPMATTTASVISVPGQNLVIQSQAPQIFMAPAQAPVMYVPQQMMAAAPASAPAANLFLPAAGVAAAPAATGATLMAAQPTMMVAAQPAAAVAAAQPTQMAAVTNQQLNLPTSDSRTRVRVRGPGMMASAAARLGQRLTQLGRASIITEQVTTLAAPLAQTGAPGMTTVTTTSAVPLAQAPPHPPVGVVPPAHAPPTPQHPPVQYPSPQGYDRDH